MAESPWFRIGWRNLGRNRKRTVLTALGLAVGFFAVGVYAVDIRVWKDHISEFAGRT